jgi:phenylacetic acid degradation operon negative regulatory protein
MANEDSVAELLSFRAELGPVGDPQRLIAEAWDLAQVSDAYDEFITTFSRLQPKTPEAVFRAQTLLVHAWRKFPFLDPDLPAAVLPAQWPREPAHDVFQDRHDAWHQTAQEYFRSVEAVNRAAA